MPYRRFPKTDTARLKSLSTLLNNSDVYAAKSRFINMELINTAKSLHDQLKTLSSQFMLSYEAQMRNYKTLAKPQKNMLTYVLHFVRVLSMSIERGEMKPAVLHDYYSTHDADELIRQLHNVESAFQLTPGIIEGEKRRIADGGRPIYNPTIGMVATHFDIFSNLYKQQRILNDKAERALNEVKKVRTEVDKLLVDIWNQVEQHFAKLPPETRFDQCRRYGIIYYYRKGETNEEKKQEKKD